VEQGKFFPCLHYLLQVSDLRSLCVSPQKVVLHGAWRGTKYKKLQKSALADSPAVQHQAPSTLNWHTLAERCHGAVVSNAFLNATDLQQPARFQRVVLQPLQLKHQPKLIAQHQCRAKALVYLKTLPSSQDEAWCREAVAWESGTHCLVQSQSAITIALRWVYQ